MGSCHYETKCVDVIMTLNGEVSLGDQMGGCHHETGWGGVILNVI